MSMSMDSTKPITFEDVIAHAQDLNLTLPKKFIEEIRTSLDNGTISGQEHMKFLDKTVEKLSEKGLRWATPESHEQNKPVNYLIDKHYNVHVYVVERTVAESQEKIYFANRRVYDEEKDKYNSVTLSKSYNVDTLKNNVAAYYTGAAINEIAKEASKNLTKETPEKTPQPQKPEPSKTPDYSPSL